MKNFLLFGLLMSANFAYAQVLHEDRWDRTFFSNYLSAKVKSNEILMITLEGYSVFPLKSSDESDEDSTYFDPVRSFSLPVSNCIISYELLIFSCKVNEVEVHSLRKRSNNGQTSVMHEKILLSNFQIDLIKQIYAQDESTSFLLTIHYERDEDFVTQSTVFY